jgi:hypothetical protein
MSIKPEYFAKAERTWTRMWNDMVKSFGENKITQHINVLSCNPNLTVDFINAIRTNNGTGI